MSQPGRGTRNRSLFVLLCAGCALATIIYGIVAARRLRPAAKTTSTEPSTASQPPQAVPANSAPSASAPKVDERAKGLLYFQTNALGDNYGKLTVAPLDAFARPRYAPDLSCDRVHFAGGRGICLVSDRGAFTNYYAVSFDEQLRRGWSIQLNGIPSRVRVSPSGRLAAITVFLAGQSYASLNFSTQTVIVDADHGQVLADLEKFSVSRDGAVFQSPDFNFWGVTFTHDENRFYATLWSKGKTYLVECDFAKRAAKVVFEGVECPSLSADNMRIAFKKRTGPATWRIWLLDLKTLTEIPLGETRSVDDQVEWLDHDHILYALSENEKGSSASTDIWALPTSIDGSPQLFLKGGSSPAVVWPK